MAIIQSGAIYYESAQSQQPFAAMTAGADLKTFTGAVKPWSNAAGYEYVVAPNGLATGGAITPAASLANDQVDTAALTAMMAAATGASATTGLLSVAATPNIAVTRGASTNVCCTTSITITSAGVIAAVAGTAAATATETRGAAGGPPLIPVGSVEIGQVRLTSITSAKVLASEIYQVVGTHTERYDYPVYSVDAASGKITFASALPAIHTGTLPKQVYVRCATPVFAEIPRAKDWVPAETSNSVSSDAYYDGAIGSVSTSVGQASFTAALNDGITDALIGQKGKTLWFKFMPDKNKTPYQLTQGVLGVSRTNAVGANPIGKFTVSASSASVDLAS